MKIDNFELKIIEQYWIDKKPENVSDICSHGEIFLKINNIIISDKEDGEWSISTFGLNLLRTIEKDHSISENYPMVDHCGGIQMMGCPISINWNLKHQKNKVIMTEITKHPSTDYEDVIDYKGLKLKLNLSDYIKISVKFAYEVKLFFENNKAREIKNNYEKEEFNNFWNEFNELFYKYK